MDCRLSLQLDYDYVREPIQTRISLNEKILFEENPEYCVMLSWHYAGPIIKNLRNKGLKSKIIVPLPDVNIIG